jgi:nitrile hydratase accessory protein
MPPEPAAVFAAPWQAQAFALVVALNEAGVFDWSDWTEALAARLDPAAEGEDAYYAAWLDALESLLAARGLASPDALRALAAAWTRAAEATPHGTPIELSNDPQAGA